MKTQSLPEPKPVRINADATPDCETEIRLRYGAIRSGVPDGMSITVLHIGVEQTTVTTGKGPEPGATLALAIGSQKTGGDHFDHDPPTPGELENAILAVEDEVVRTRKMIADRSTLFTTDAAVRTIALVAGVADRSDVLTLDAVERTFERLIAVTLGRPASVEGLPTGAAFAATLLILREFMHHLQFTSITLRAFECHAA